MALLRSVFIQLEKRNQTAGPAYGYADESSFPQRANEVNSGETVGRREVQTIAIAIPPRQSIQAGFYSERRVRHGYPTHSVAR